MASQLEVGACVLSRSLLACRPFLAWPEACAMYARTFQGLQMDWPVLLVPVSVSPDTVVPPWQPFPGLVVRQKACTWASGLWYFHAAFVVQ